jgi:hypothetical protein
LRVIWADWISAGQRAKPPAKPLDHTIVYPSTVFSPQELQQIGVFCEAMGLDVGKLDIIRDREDQRIYILDANKTPQLNPGWTGARRAFFIHTVEHVAQALSERYPARSAVPVSPMPVAAPDGTNDTPDEAGSLLERMEVQTERLGRLEVAVDAVGAEIARVRTTNGIVPGSRKKKRKT